MVSVCVYEPFSAFDMSNGGRNFIIKNGSLKPLKHTVHHMAFVLT